MTLRWLLRESVRSGTLAAPPFSFGDPTPWRLGWHLVYPSLVVHLVFALAVAWTARPLLQPITLRHRREGARA